MAALACAVIVSALVGYLVGRWWALLLAVVPALVLLPVESNEGASVGVLIAIYGSPVMLASLAAGVALRKRREGASLGDPALLGLIGLVLAAVGGAVYLIVIWADLGR